MLQSSIMLRSEGRAKCLLTLWPGIKTADMQSPKVVGQVAMVRIYLWMSQVSLCPGYPKELGDTCTD